MKKDWQKTKNFVSENFITKKKEKKRKGTVQCTLRRDLMTARGPHFASKEDTPRARCSSCDVVDEREETLRRDCKLLLGTGLMVDMTSYFMLGAIVVKCFR